MMKFIRNLAHPAARYVHDFNIVFTNLISQNENKFFISGPAIATHVGVFSAFLLASDMSVFFVAAVLMSYVSILTNLDNERNVLGIVSAALSSVAVPGYLLVRICVWLLSINRTAITHIYVCSSKRFAIPAVISVSAVLSAAISNMPGVT